MHNSPWNHHGYGEGANSNTQYSQYETQLEEIQTLLNCEESTSICNGVKGEAITVFIGNTRSGKSTLVNFAIGNQLKAVKMEDWPHALCVVNANDCEGGPKIGLESVSETTLPSVWPAPMLGPEEKVVDAPGFEDNRGEAQDIANTFYIREIIRNAKSVKFVLITDINDIMSQNISNFTNFIDKIHRIFPETRVLHGGIALVFSKGDGTCTVDDMCSFFKKRILSQQELQVEKSLIKYFVDHKEFIAFFKMPRSEGPIIGGDVDGGILDIIRDGLSGIRGHVLSDVKPGISDKSRAFLLESYSYFCNIIEYEDLLKQIEEIFTKKCMDMFDAESTEELTEMHEAMLHLERQFLELLPQSKTDLKLKDTTKHLSSLCNVCGIDGGNIPNKIHFVEFLDHVLNRRNGDICTMKFLETIGKIENQFNMARTHHATILGRIRDLEKERRERLSAEQLNEELRDMLNALFHPVRVVPVRVPVDPCRIV